MNNPFYLEFKFWGALSCSVIIPTILFAWMTWRRSISAFVIIVIGLFLVFIAGIDAIFLRLLSAKAKATPDILDDKIFVSEISIALYIIPLILAGIGVNLASHVLCNHIIIAELDEEKEKIQAIGP